MNRCLSGSLRSSAKLLGFFANMRQKPLANFATAGGKKIYGSSPFTILAVVAVNE